VPAPSDQPTLRPQEAIHSYPSCLLVTALWHFQVFQYPPSLAYHGVNALRAVPSDIHSVACPGGKEASRPSSYRLPQLLDLASLRSSTVHTNVSPWPTRMLILTHIRPSLDLAQIYGSNAAEPCGDDLKLTTGPHKYSFVCKSEQWHMTHRPARTRQVLVPLGSRTYILSGIKVLIEDTARTARSRTLSSYSVVQLVRSSRLCPLYLSNRRKQPHPHPGDPAVLSRESAVVFYQRGQTPYIGASPKSRGDVGGNAGADMKAVATYL
jgi:hypothetical protein